MKYIISQQYSYFKNRHTFFYNWKKGIGVIKHLRNYRDMKEKHVLKLSTLKTKF